MNLTRIYDEQIWIYREGHETELPEGFSGRILSGENIMAGLELSMEKLALNLD